MSEHNLSKKDIKEAYARVLEKIVDTSVRMGFDINTRYQSALSMMIQGDSYLQIARTYGITKQEAAEYVERAVKELELFLNRLQTLEQQRQEAEDRVERIKRDYEQRLTRLRNQITEAKGQIAEGPKALLDIPIHKLPFSPMLQSVLLKAGYYTLSEVSQTGYKELSSLPGMTPPMMEAVKKYIYAANVSKKISNR